MDSLRMLYSILKMLLNITHIFPANKNMFKVSHVNIKNIILMSLPADFEHGNG